MWRRVIGSGYLAMAVALATACGGNVEGGSHDPEDGSPPAKEPTKSTPDQSQGTDNPDADTDLGDCALGPAENYGSDAACAWVADKRCYQTREMACNCACPRSRNSQCSSGFEDGPDGHVWVACN